MYLLHYNLIKKWPKNINRIQSKGFQGFWFTRIFCHILMITQRRTVGALSSNRGTRQTPWLTECEAFLFTHEIIDNSGSALGGTGPES